MILLPDQVVPFLQHDDPIVRDQALRYFRDTHDFGPLTADHYWAALDRFGENDQTLGFASGLRNLPQTDTSLRRLVDALAGKPSENFKYHFQQAARDMDLRVLARHRDELLGAPRLSQDVREHLELRLKLLDQSPAAAWERLMTHGREVADKYLGEFDPGLSDALIEASARGGKPICEQAMAMFADPSVDGGWPAIFAVRVVGEARYAEAIDALVNLFGVDTDLQRVEANNALSSYRLSPGDRTRCRVLCG